MPWYDGLTYLQVEEAIREGRAPGSMIPGTVIEVPDEYTDWLANRNTHDRLIEFRNKWPEDSELINMAKGMERSRIVGILRANAKDWGSNTQEPDWVRGIVSRALNSIADSLERESG